MELSFEKGPSGRVEVSESGNVNVKVALRGIRGALHLGHHTDCQLHWACLDDNGGWVAPTFQPQGSGQIDPVASRIKCAFECTLSFPKEHVPKKIVFVVFVQGNGQDFWLKSRGGEDFVVPVAELAVKAAQDAAAAEAAAAAAAAEAAAATRPVNLAARLAPDGAPARLAERPKAWEDLDKARALKGSKLQKGSGTLVNNLGQLEWYVVKGAEKFIVLVEAAVPLPASVQLYLHFGCLADAEEGEGWECPEELSAGAVPTGDGKAARILFDGQARAVLKFNEKTAPGALLFYVYAVGPGGDQYVRNNEDQPFRIAIQDDQSGPPKPEDVLGKKICAAETKYTHWTHFQRLCMLKDVLGKSGLTEGEAAWITCDLRLASQKCLDWYRKRGYQPKDMAHISEAVGGVMASAVSGAQTPAVRALLRLAVRSVPRGSSSGGDDIRHGILNIMRNHGIKEGHRPGIECKFIEAWHQKLHTNSAPDDIAICEGYLAYLGSGNTGDMFRVIYDKAGYTREDLSKMCQAGWHSDGNGLNHEPLHLPQLRRDMEGYLHLLKRVHGGTDLFALCEGCKGQYPDHGAECMAFEIFQDRDNPFVMGKITELRGRLRSELWKRDILMLDVALEDQMRSLSERQKLDSIGRDDLVGVLACLLNDLRLSRQDASIDFGADLYCRLAQGDHGGEQRWSAAWCKLMLAACDRLSIVCAELADRVATLLQQCADKLRVAGSKPSAVFAVDPKVLATFGEETARCLSERLVAQCLKHLTPQLRQGAGLGAWEVVSQGGGAGTIGSVAVMKALPDTLPAELAPCIAVTDTLTGWEDIPAGIVAVLLPAAHAVDVLSHVAIRARNQKVLLASCDEDDQLTQLRQLDKKTIELTIDAGGAVKWAAATAQSNSAIQQEKPKQLAVPKTPPPPAQVLSISQFEQHRRCLGGKSFHLSELKPKNGEYKVPPSATVPFGMFEAVLDDAANKKAKDELQEIIADERWADARKHVVSELQVPETLRHAIQEEMAKVGAPLPGDAPWQQALKSVWASKWTDRAVSSRKQMSVPEDALKLAVLVQPLAFASYAFVIHTRSPMATAKPDDALIEVVVGLGESLVSNSPGRALSASVGPGDSSIDLHTFPSKPQGVFAPESGTHIFRSDSNGEDLEGFAGAGLYDSITVVDCPHRPVNYANEPLLFDLSFRNSLLRRLFDLGRLVEANFKGQPQDIEGAVLSSGELVVLQSRPQV